LQKLSLAQHFTPVSSINQPLITMKTTAIAAILAASVAATPAAIEKRATSVTPVTVKGNAFFAGDKRFYIRGVDYQPGTRVITSN
jgi:hypothetical protein